MTRAPNRATVFDTSVLSNFAHVDRVELLCDLPRPATVDVVRTELESGVETHPYLRTALAALDDEIPVCSPSERAAELESALRETLDPGEAQALAVATANDGSIVTEDGDARASAARRNVAVVGSIGVLVRFVEDGAVAVDVADRYLTRWIDEAGFRSPARDIDEFLPADSDRR